MTDTAPLDVPEVLALLAQVVADSERRYGDVLAYARIFAYELGES